ncbi:hypothetical protein IIA95_02895 [Patescibacteria group bacterium]|nr:hypothetical protein [Patescibacteria group bacterium]
METNSKWPYLIVSVAIIVGFGGGFFYGNAKGRTDLLVEQKAAVEKAKTEAQEQIAQSTNPFEATKVNPFKDVYKNPFSQ